MVKFFIPVVIKYPEYFRTDDRVYGPYEDEKAVRDAISARIWPKDGAQFIVFDGCVVSASKRKPGKIENFMIDTPGKWVCRGCGFVIEASKLHSGGRILCCPYCDEKVFT